MASLPTSKVNALRDDIKVFDNRIRSGVASKRVNVTDKHLGRWEQFCLELNVDPHLQTWDDPIPIIQVFGERNRDVRLTPLHNTIKSCMMEDALRKVGQVHARLGGADSRKDHHGGIDFRIERHIRAYEKSNDPPR
jgi:hypothetical protein